MSPELERLTRAAVAVADALDSGERDPTWHESQELEEAAIQYGRSVRQAEEFERRQAEYRARDRVSVDADALRSNGRED